MSFDLLHCERIHGYFRKFQDGTLDPETHEFVKQHLLTCDDCMGAFDEYVVTGLEAGTIPVPDIPPAPVPTPGLEFTAPPFPILSTLASHITEIADLAKKQVGSFWQLLETNLDQTAAALEQSFNEAIGFVPQHFGAERPMRASGETPEDKIAKEIHRLVQEKELPPNIREGARALANALGALDSEKLDSASNVLNDLLRKQESLELRLILAYCYKRQGHQQKAETQIAKALELARAGK